MTSRTRSRTTALVALITPLAAAGVLATSAPAHAIPSEGEPTANDCLRVVPLADAGPAGSPLFVSHGYALVLRSGADCSASG